MTKAPGSVYDDNTTDGTLAIASKTAMNQDIPAEPTNSDTNDYLKIKGVSADGSHILMSTAATPECENTNNAVNDECPEGASQNGLHGPSPGRLYMRVNDLVTYEVSKSELTGERVDVHYAGMTPDGSKVFFTSEEHLTAEDPDHGGPSLYMWSQEGQEKGHPLTLISKAAPGSAAQAGNTEDCSPVSVPDYQPEGGFYEYSPWTNKCGVALYSSRSYSLLTGDRGGTGLSDNFIAANNGDIYFFSPEQLDGVKGVANQENMYVYRNGQVQYVTTLAPGGYCSQDPQATRCSNGPVVRMQVSPDDTHMAFVTASRITSYDNAGHLEMYSYEPSNGSITCDSCIPDGEPPSYDVSASQDGLFMTNDGRTFFSTQDALVRQDTNRGVDVYEFVEGRPQLITPGTGTAQVTTQQSLISTESTPGLYGVSANGTDVYFSAYESLVHQDENGNQLAFYDARTNGGFPFVPPPPSCAAADECHGAGSSPPSPPLNGTGANLGAGGNVDRIAPSHHRPRHRKRRVRHRPRRRHGKR